MFFTPPPPPPLLSLRVIRNLLSKCAENQAIRFWELVGSFFCALVVIGSPQAFAKSSQSVENLLDAEFKVEALENWLLVEQEIDKSELASLYLETENAEEYLGMLTDLVTEYMENAELSHYEIDADSYDFLIVELLLAHAQSGVSGVSEAEARVIEAEARIIEVIGTACGSAGGRAGCGGGNAGVGYGLVGGNVGGQMCAVSCNKPPVPAPQKPAAPEPSPPKKEDKKKEDKKKEDKKEDHK